MGTSTTTNYGFVKSNPFEEEDTWGQILNSTIDAIDAAIKARADAITALDAAKQPLDPQLTAIAGLNPAADRLPYFTGATTASLATFTSFARTLLAGTSAAAMQTTLGLGSLSTLSAVGTAQITDASVTTAKLADGAVTDIKIADGAVTAAKLAAGAVPVAFPSGTRMLFQQAAAPTGWTKDLTHNNKALRVVSGTTGSGGTVPFTTAFAVQTASGTTSSTAAGGDVGPTALTIAQMPLHGHPFQASYFTQSTASSQTTGGFMTSTAGVSSRAAYTGGVSNTQGQQIGGEGGGQAHDHTFTGAAHTHTFSAAIDLTVQYVDLIIAVKD